MRILSICLLLLVFYSCNEQSINPDTSVDDIGSMLMKIDLTEAPAEVVKISGNLTRTNYDTIFFDFLIVEETASARVLNIPHGAWTLTVNAFNDANNILYTGTTTVFIATGTDNQANLHLNPTTGNLEIIVTWGDKNSDSGLVLYCPFEGNASDMSGNNIYTNVQGAILTTDRHGKAESAYYFDGVNDYIQVLNSELLHITGELTLSAWVCVESFESSGGIISKGLMFNGHEFQGAYGVGIYKGNRKVYLDIRTDEEPRRAAVSERSLSKEQWYYIAGTFLPGFGLKLYINGELNQITEFSDRHISHFTEWHNNDVRIGDSQQSQIDPNRFPGFFNGKIDEVRIYNKALTQEEIKKLMSED